jgi:anthranilate phosphoribosyltransferase
MKNFLLRLSEQKSFSEEEMKSAIKALLKEDITDGEIAGFLMGLKVKGETVEEITGIVKVLKENSIIFPNKYQNIIDNCGTGGDGSNSFNISTTSAFVIAAAGARVAKHGNRSISSKAGSADVLEYLGVNLHLSTEKIDELLREVGIAFLYAPNVHPKLKKIINVRKQLKVPTIFNFIGPLTNPINLDYQLLGVYRRDLLKPFAEVLKALGRKRSIVINGAGYLDEASLQGENHIAILENGQVSLKTFFPEEVGLSRVDNNLLKGGCAKDNGEILLSVLKGEKSVYREAVLLNAGLGIYTARLAETIEQGIDIAKRCIDTGTALEKLQLLKTKSQKEVS